MGALDHAFDLFEYEKQLNLQLEHWSLIEESNLHQKSKMTWLKLGDAKTKVFFLSLKRRQAQNYIKHLMSLSGIVLSNLDKVQQEVFSFYFSLLGTAAQSLPAIDPNVMNRGPVLTRSQQLDLIKPVTRNEIADALKGIDGNKAAGCDGMNACFFHKAWHIVGDDVMETLLNFSAVVKCSSL